MLAVTEGNTARSVNTHSILVELAHLNDNTSVLPTLRVVPCKVLQEHLIANLERGQGSGMFIPSLVSTGMAPGKGFLTMSHQFTPRGVRAISTEENGNGITNRPAENDHGGGCFCLRVYSIPVGQHGSLELVCV